MVTDLVDVIDHIFANYGTVRAQPYGGHWWPGWLKTSATEALSEIADTNELSVRYGDGTGGFPQVAWFGLSHARLAETSEKGLYVTFLFDMPLTKVVLSMQQGVKAMEKTIGLKASRSVLRERGAIVRQRLPAPVRLTADSIALLSTYRTGKSYESAHVVGRSYDRSQLDRESLRQDLAAMVEYYLAFLDDPVVVRLVNSAPGLDEDDPTLTGDSISMGEDDFNDRYRSLIRRLAAAATAQHGSARNGTTIKTTTAKRRIGQEALRQALLLVYEPTCAACEETVTRISSNGRTRYCLQAAHIISVADRGSTWVGNGLLLCPNHHWAFDNHCWWIEDDGTIVVSSSPIHPKWLTFIHGRKVVRPKFDWAAPRTEALQFHRSLALKGPRQRS